MPNPILSALNQNKAKNPMMQMIEMITMLKNGNPQQTATNSMESWLRLS